MVVVFSAGSQWFACQAATCAPPEVRIRLPARPDYDFSRGVTQCGARRKSSEPLDCPLVGVNSTRKNLARVGPGNLSLQASQNSLMHQVDLANAWFAQYLDMVEVEHGHIAHAVELSAGE
jgi:hypothetical protein